MSVNGQIWTGSHHAFGAQHLRDHVHGGGQSFQWSDDFGHDDPFHFAVAVSLLDIEGKSDVATTENLGPSKATAIGVHHRERFFHLHSDVLPNPDCPFWLKVASAQSLVRAMSFDAQNIVTNGHSEQIKNDVTGGLNA